MIRKLGSLRIVLWKSSTAQVFRVELILEVGIDKLTMFGAVSIILSTSKSINAPWTNAKHVAADDKVIRVKDPVFVVAMVS